MPVLHAVLAAWAALAAAAWPWAALAAALLLLAARVAQPTAKSYSTEQRVTTLETWSQPVAVQPSSSPPAAETWHDFPAGAAGWGLGTGGWKKYRLTAEGSVQVSINLALIGTQTDNTVIFTAGALPPGYRPASGGRYLPAALDTSGAVFYGGNHTPYLVFRTDGSVAVFGVNAAGLNQLQCNGTISLF